MSVSAPHFLLYAEAAKSADSVACDAGRWRFSLRLPSGETSVEAADEELDATPERLELLAVIRGLEALSQPSRVTLLSGSRAIRRGLEYGLSQWRENDWQWERYGRLAAVKNRDLWQRLDRLLEFHAVECRPTRLDKADDLAPPPPPAARTESVRRKRDGLTFRIDKPHTPAKFEAQSTKSETNPKHKFANSRKRSPSRRSDFVNSNSLRDSKFMPRALNLFVGWLVKTVSAHWLRSTNKEF